MKNANLIQEKVLLLKCFLSKVNDISYEDVLRDIPDDIDDGFLIHLEHIGFSFANNQEISAIDKQNLRILLTNENFRKFIIYSILSNFLK